MTIIAGFSSSRQGSAPLNLAVRIARSTGEKVIAAAVVEAPSRPSLDPVEGEYLSYVSKTAKQSLENVVRDLPDDVDVSVIVHQARSIPSGLMELTTEHNASLVVVGSSSSGLLGKVTLGTVTERLVHTANVPVAIAPRGYPITSAPIGRLTAAYGGNADANRLIAGCGALCERWSAALRIASFTVRPIWKFAGSVEPPADDLVVEQWARRTFDAVERQLKDARDLIPIPNVEVVIGNGRDWQAAVEDIPWATGDLLVLGSGSAGTASHVFLGSAAAKILRHSPAPVMIMPRQLDVQA